MSQPEIVEKLEKLLKIALPFTQESEVVYLWVETRKILDRANDKSFPLLRFYADWSVHTSKDRITPGIRSIMEEVYSDIHLEITNPGLLIGRQSKIVGFMYMEDLQKEMYSFFQKYRVSSDWVNNNDDWIAFISLLVRVLANQPINKPCTAIRQFLFYPTKEGCVAGTVMFRNKIEKYERFSFGNSY